MITAEEPKMKYVILLIRIQQDSQSFYGHNEFEMQLPGTLNLADAGWHWWVKVFISPLFCKMF